MAYKETHYDTTTDPQDPPTWTGTWMDPRFSPPGGRREAAERAHRSAVRRQRRHDRHHGARLSTASSGSGATPGWRAWRPASRPRWMRGPALSATNGMWTPTTGSAPQGSWTCPRRPTPPRSPSPTTAARPRPQTTTHHLTLYRAPSGALVFGAGTVQWSWGLDSANPSGKTDTAMQQATVNLFADMGAQPVHADLRAHAGHAIDGYDRRPHPRSPRRHRVPRCPTVRPSPSAGRQLTLAAAWSPASRSRPTAARPGIR